MFMPRLTSVTSQQLLGITSQAPDSPAPGVGDWLDDNGDVVQVDDSVGPSALQVEGVFAVNPTTPFTIRGKVTAATGVVTNISANTGTLLEIETDAAGEFTAGERLEII
jgi:hypothetical protein